MVTTVATALRRSHVPAPDFSGTPWQVCIARSVGSVGRNLCWERRDTAREGLLYLVTRDPRTEALLTELEQAYLGAVDLGFLGPREGERLRERHIEDALGLASLRPPVAGEQWVDLGSGAGLPGLPLAAAFRETSFTLVDAHRRRLDWVMATARRLGIANIRVVHARLEEYGRGAGRGRFDVGTARALGPLPVVAELGAPLLKVGGVLLVPRGRPSDEELRRLAEVGEILGIKILDVIHNPSSPIDQVSSVVIMAKIAATSPRFPRRSGVPARNPLGEERPAAT
jgi:16S rRNA (guanine527-N7)-methyltransferase